MWKAFPLIHKTTPCKSLCNRPKCRHLAAAGPHREPEKRRSMYGDKNKLLCVEMPRVSGAQDFWQGVKRSPIASPCGAELTMENRTAVWETPGPEPWPIDTSNNESILFYEVRKYYNNYSMQSVQKNISELIQYLSSEPQTKESKPLQLQYMSLS